MNYINFRITDGDDVQKMSKLLLNSPKKYLQYFHPFDFQENSIQEILSKSNKDIFFSIELIKKASNILVGFYMLRGLDEGYSEPMYGVFVSSDYQNYGIGRLSLFHAECYCKMIGYKRLLLKVYPENIKAKKLYNTLGFQFLRNDPQSKQTILYKDIQ
ncbi:MAG: GNAT family N-acetyltransferase [Snowella sp.]|nr:GNAT family N-acetyltransferase [Snowella sp.]